MRQLNRLKSWSVKGMVLIVLRRNEECNHIYRNRKIANYRYQGDRKNFRAKEICWTHNKCKSLAGRAKVNQWRITINKRRIAINKWGIDDFKKRCKEELQTVNAELHNKLSDFEQANNDMKNLLNSTEIATLFLDKELNIRRFDP
jgi:hypothetical protein